MKKIFIFAFPLLLTTINAPANASDSRGTASADFLRSPVGARYAAMGETGTAFADDANALHWNPANLSAITQPQAALSYSDSISTLHDQFGGVVFPAGVLGTLGFAAKSLSYGTIDATNVSGAKTGEFSPRDVAYTVGWGKGLLQTNGLSLGIGANVKLIESRLENSASAVAGDVGVRVHKDKLTVGAALRNTGQALQYDRENTPLAQVTALGVAVQPFEPWLLSFETQWPRAGDAVYGVGTEFRVVPSPVGLFLRGGYTTRAHQVNGTQGLTLGMGLRWSLLSLDYAWVPIGDLGQDQRFSMLIAF